MMRRRSSENEDKQQEKEEDDDNLSSNYLRLLRLYEMISLPLHIFFCSQKITNSIRRRSHSHHIHFLYGTYRQKRGFPRRTTGGYSSSSTRFIAKTKPFCSVKSKNSRAALPTA